MDFLILVLFCVALCSLRSTAASFATTLEGAQSFQSFEHHSIEFNRKCKSQSKQWRFRHIRFRFGSRSCWRADPTSIGACSWQSQSHNVNDIRLVRDWSLLYVHRTWACCRPQSQFPYGPRKSDVMCAKHSCSCFVSVQRLECHIWKCNKYSTACSGRTNFRCTQLIIWISNVIKVQWIWIMANKRHTHAKKLHLDVQKRMHFSIAIAT